MAAGSPPSSAPKAFGVPMVAGARLPLAFIALGLAALAGATVWLAVAPQLLQLSHAHPHVVALAHLWLPGFLLSTSMGAMYQLMPVVLGSPLPSSERTGWVHWGLHAAGLVLLVGGFVRGRFDLVGTGGTVISIGVMLFTWTVLRTFASATRRDAVAWSFPLSALWLAVTVVAGVLFAINRHAPFLDLSPLALLRAHAHLGMIGFFLTLLQGATFQLVPMFTMADLRCPRAIAAGLLLTQIALPLLLAGLAWGSAPLTLAGGAVIAAGMAMTAAALRVTLGSRRRRHLEPGLQAFLTGAGFLGLGAVFALAMAAVPDGSAPQASPVGYGVFVIAGGLGLTLLGMLCKIIPFLVWMRTYGPRIGRQTVPTAASLATPSLERLWLALHITAVVLLAGSALAGLPRLGAAAAWLLALGIGAYLVNAGRVFSHTWKPRAGTVTPRPINTSS